MSFDMRHAFDTAAHVPRHVLPEVQLLVVTGPEEPEVASPAHVADGF